MSGSSTKPPRLPRVRPDVTIRALSGSEYVVKVADRREYFNVGADEAMLLELLDGTRSISKLLDEFYQRLGRSLPEADLHEFIAAVKPLGLFETRSKNSTTSSRSSKSSSSGSARASSASPKSTAPATAGSPDHIESATDDELTGPVEGPRRLRLQDQSLIFFRVPLWNPDRFLATAVGIVPFLWSRAFVVFASMMMVVAMFVMISNMADMAAVVPEATTWQDVVLFVAVMLACTALHEVAHGATLKYFGGQVHDSGLLFMFFAPCMYCNVSDAWLLPEKWKRMCVTAAGGFCDLCVWAVSVFVWRITVPDTIVNSLALMTLTICGGRSLLNFNPLLRLDGYYLLSDWLAIPNLRPRALEYWMSHLRWLLWGAARPPSIDRRGVLLAYGVMCWCFALVFLDLVLVQLAVFFNDQVGLIGLIVIGLLASFGFKRVFKGLFSGEFAVMLKTRTTRTMSYAVGALLIAAALFLIPVPSTVGGDFEVRAGEVAQVHVPASGVVQRVHVQDGDVVAAGQLLAELKSASLDADILKTEDMKAEVESVLNRLLAGTRPEELAAQHDHVTRLERLLELAQQELTQARFAHEQERLIQSHRLQEYEAQINNARQDLAHSERLYQLGALAGAQLRAERLSLLSLESRQAQAKAASDADEAMGLQSREIAVTRTAQDVDDARDRLKLLQAGSRPEDIAAERARLTRVEHELEFLRSQKDKLQLRAPVAGVFAAPRLIERIGQPALQDSVFCVIEQPESARVEISVSEDDAAHVYAGQPVTLKARSLAFDSFQAVVESISATTSKTGAMGGPQKNVIVVHCRIENPNGQLKSGMTGFGRISRGWKSIGTIFLSRGLRFLRTEFWW